MRRCYPSVTRNPKFCPDSRSVCIPKASRRRGLHVSLLYVLWFGLSGWQRTPCTRCLGNACHSHAVDEWQGQSPRVLSTTPFSWRLLRPMLYSNWQSSFPWCQCRGQGGGAVMSTPIPASQRGIRGRLAGS